MRARGGLKPCPRKRQPPSVAAREAIACIRRYLECGATPAEVAQAHAALAAMDAPRQQALALALKVQP